MIVAPIVVMFIGYTVASYGIVLMKSWEIPFRAWVSPLNPYQWPADGSPPPTMPDGQLLPGGNIAPGTLPSEAPAGVSNPTWQVVKCLALGGLDCIPGAVGNDARKILKKLFGI